MAPAFVVMSSPRKIVPVLVIVTAPRSVLNAPPKVVFALPEFIVTAVVVPSSVPTMVESVIAPSSVVRPKAAASTSVIPVSKSIELASPSVSIDGDVPVNLTPEPPLKVTLH